MKSRKERSREVQKYLETPDFIMPPSLWYVSAKKKKEKRCSLSVVPQDEVSNFFIEISS